jgi:hypothetical protein
MTKAHINLGPGYSFVANVKIIGKTVIIKIPMTTKKDAEKTLERIKD